MTRFLETNRGWVNADEIARIYDGAEDRSAVVVLKDGAVHGASCGADLCVKFITSTMVPAPIGYSCAAIDLYRPSDCTIDQFKRWFEPVIAFAYSSDAPWPQPLTVEGDVAGDYVIGYPSGRFVLPHHQSFDSIERLHSYLVDFWAKHAKSDASAKGPPQ